MGTAEPSRIRPVALAGRENELSRLNAELKAAVEARSFRAVFVHGPAGVGRTALLGAFASRLAEAPVAVLSARADRPRSAAFGLVAPVARAALELVRPSAPAAVVSSFEKALAPLFGETAPGGQTPAELADAFADLILATGRDRPLLVAFDDADAADPASLGLISYLLGTLLAPAAARAPDRPAGGGLVLLSRREEATPPLLAELVARVPGLSLPVAPFDLEQVRGWLAQQGAERLFEVSGGVPAKLAELIDPAGAIDFAARRLERLTEADRGVLAALAVLRRPSDATLVAEVSGKKDAAVRLGQLSRARLVEAAPGAGRTLYSCFRTTDRDAVFAALSPIARRDLETRAARALEALGEVEAAFALYQAAGDARAASVGLAAAERLWSRGALDAAREVLEQVVARADGTGRSSALVLLAEVAERQGDPRAALAAWGRARALAEPWRRREIRAKSSRLCLALGAPRPAERLARAVLAAGTGDLAGSEATAALAEARFLRGAYAEALSIAESAVAPQHRLALANTRGKALLTLGRLDEAHQAFLANAQGALAAGDGAERTRALLNAGVVAHRQGRRSEAKSAYRTALLESASSLQAVVHANLASLALEEGEAEEALAEAHRAISAFSRAGQKKEQAHAAENLARVYLYLGDLSRAGELALHAADLARQVGDPYLAAGAALVDAEVRFAQGEEAADAFTQSASRFAALQNPRYERESLLLLAEAELTRGRAWEAHAALERARKAGALSSPALAAGTHLLEAELALGSGEEPAVAEALAAARRALLEEPQLELPARLYFLEGALAEKRGQPERAQAERLKAAHLVEELAARVPPDRRALFYARRRRRAILDAVGTAFQDAERLIPARPLSRRGAALPPLVGATAAIERVNALIDRFGLSPATVLVRGESGTGKELVARALHDKSPRKSLPLVAVNCGALNEELLLSELFGHEKGAFTGAVKERKGRFELADGGTIFLDEIGDISPRAQVALLRVLQERSFERVGGSRTISVDVRVVCATNRDLEALMAKGAFREDLYYRLRGATLLLPSLRERLADLPLLCAHHLAKEAAKGGEVRALSAEALRLFARYPWPGNVRELFNVLDTALLFATGPTLGPEAFELFPELFAERVAAPLPAGAPDVGARHSDELDFFEVLTGRGCSLTDLHREVDRACMEGAMQQSGGVISEAARTLGMTRSRLSQLLHQEPSQRGWRRSAAADEPDELASNLQHGTVERGGSR